MKKTKVIFITGASKGFGLEMTKAALSNGDKVIAAARNGTQELFDELGRPANLLAVKMDVTNEAQIAAAVTQALDTFSAIDVLINNAGYGMLTAVEEASAEEVRKQYETNVFGVLNVIRAILPAMRRQHSGHIINISSLFAYGVGAGWGIYGSTKAALESISKAMARELMPIGINVTALAPGLFTTSFLNKESYQQSKKPIQDYAGTVGKMRSSMANIDGNQPGDPKKLAQLAIMIAHEPNPPLHLLVGPDAVNLYRETAMSTAREVEQWLPWSMSTDHL